ncbi:MAG: XRE family transcriptional regulator [Hyphomicrobiales bacterium]|nr:MAG: XRE family transcriptional regulator [Hyphomicrobiales bacterium]
MENRTESLIATLREARGRKGWSQRDLSQRAGMTQAHLSRIESGAVDLKLSTFLELARLLDLEPILAPRSALSALNAVIREADANREARSVRGAANSLQQLVRIARLQHPEEPAVERLSELLRGLHPLEPLFRKPSELAELQDITDQLQSAGRHADLANLKKAVDRLAQLRNRLVHSQPETPRPAYSLDDED